MKISPSLLTILSLTTGINGFAGLNQNSANRPIESPAINRRESFAKVATIFGGVTAGLVTSSFPNVASAVPSEETARTVTRMGGLLVSLV